VFQYRDATPYSAVSKVVDNTHYLHNDDATNLTDKSVPQTSVFSSSMVSHEQINSQQHVLGDTINSQLNFYNMDQQNSNISPDTNSFIKKTVRKPVLKKTFTLKKIGYKVIPYEDENDSRYCFTNENIVFVNKAHSTYKVESERGEEFLFRHITNIVAEVVVGSRYPEARDILEIQNKLISEAIKLHDYSLLKK
jgi:phage pi2 protein 07